MTMIDVSEIWNQECALMSGSVSELGDRAGEITWSNCLKVAERHPLVTDANRQDIRDHFAEYGAWEEEEINAWSDVELSAMVWQEAAADMRHFEDHCDSNLEAYERDCEAGRVSGRLMLCENIATICLGV